VMCNGAEEGESATIAGTFSSALHFFLPSLLP
jgi:hypothetical protein